MLTYATTDSGDFLALKNTVIKNITESNFKTRLICIADHKHISSTVNI